MRPAKEGTGQGTAPEGVGRLRQPPCQANIGHSSTCMARLQGLKPPGRGVRKSTSGAERTDWETGSGTGAGTVKFSYVGICYRALSHAAPDESGKE